MRATATVATGLTRWKRAAGEGNVLTITPGRTRIRPAKGTLNHSPVGLCSRKSSRLHREREFPCSRKAQRRTRPPRPLWTVKPRRWLRPPPRKAQRQSRPSTVVWHPSREAYCLEKTMPAGSQAGAVWVTSSATPTGHDYCVMNSASKRKDAGLTTLPALAPQSERARTGRDSNPHHRCSRLYLPELFGLHGSRRCSPMHRTVCAGGLGPAGGRHTLG